MLPRIPHLHTHRLKALADASRSQLRGLGAPFAVHAGSIAALPLLSRVQRPALVGRTNSSPCHASTQSTVRAARCSKHGCRSFSWMIRLVAPSIGVGCLQVHSSDHLCSMQQDAAASAMLHNEARCNPMLSMPSSTYSKTSRIG